MNVRTAQLLPVHIAMYVCDHAGNRKAASDGNREDDQTRQRKPRRIGCPAKIKKVTMNDGSVSATYHWQYPDCQLFDVKEIASSQLPPESKEWIEKHVNDFIDWKAIKSLLRMNEDNINEIISVSGSGFPTSSGQHYMHQKIR